MSAGLEYLDWNSRDGKTFWTFDRFLPYYVHPIDGQIEIFRGKKSVYAENLESVEEKFQKWSTGVEFQSVGKVLGVGDKFIEECISMKKKGNMTLGWKGLRQILGHEWVKRADLLFFNRLFHGQIACLRCHLHGARHGSIGTKNLKLLEHEADKDHARRFSESYQRQLDIKEAGMETSLRRHAVELAARSHVVARLVAGAGGNGDGAAGIPPISIPAMFDQDMFVVSSYCLLTCKWSSHS